MALGYLSDTAREAITLFSGILDPKEGVHCTLQVALHCKKSSHVEGPIRLPIMCIDVTMSSISSNDCVPLSEYQIIYQKDVSTLLRDLSCSSSKKTGISCKTPTLPPIGQRRKAIEKPSAVKEHCTSLPVLQNNQLGTWSELGGSIDLLSSHSTVTRLRKREHSIRSDGNGRSTGPR